MKAVLKEKSIGVNVYIKKENLNLTLHLMGLEKEEQTKSNASRRNTIQMKAEIKNIQNFKKQ